MKRNNLDSAMSYRQCSLSPPSRGAFCGLGFFLTDSPVRIMVLFAVLSGIKDARVISGMSDALF